MSLTPVAGWTDDHTLSIGLSIHDGPATTDGCIPAQHLHVISQVIGHAVPILGSGPNADAWVWYGTENRIHCQPSELLDNVMAHLVSVAMLFDLTPMSDEALQAADAWIAANGGREV